MRGGGLLGFSKVCPGWGIGIMGGLVDSIFVNRETAMLSWVWLQFSLNLWQYTFSDQLPMRASLKKEINDGNISLSLLQAL